MPPKDECERQSKCPHHHSHNDRAQSDHPVGSKICTNRDDNRASRLLPEPQRRTPIVFEEIADQRVINTEQPHHFDCLRGEVHLATPCTAGRPRHNVINAFRERCTSRRPFGVSTKYFFARPPRSGVGSPSQDVTSPFASRRSSAA